MATGNDFPLANKVALITGGSRGIGKATALGFARAGADVVVASRKLADLNQVAQEIQALDKRALAIEAHLGKLEDIQRLVERVTAEFGKIDILVNNAGTNPTLCPTIDADERLWNSIINLNVKGLFFLSQAVARIMREHGEGRIINVASMDAFKPELNMGIYAISKAAVIMTTQVMAVEWAEYNIRVNCIAPGNVHTRLGDSRFTSIPGYEDQMLKKTPLGRIAEPDEMVGAMIYLASDASSFVTGETLNVNGGILLT